MNFLAGFLAGFFAAAPVAFLVAAPRAGGAAAAAPFRGRPGPRRTGALPGALTIAASS